MALGRTLVALVTLFFVPVKSALAQAPAKPISADVVAEAIEFGKSHAVAQLEAAYKLLDYRPTVTVETPFYRIAKAAAEANEKAQAEYKPFKTPVITPAMKAPGITIHALILPDFRTPFTDVKNIVIMPAGKTERSDVIQPTRKTPLTSSIKNAAGGRVSATSLSAQFPASVLAEGNEIRVVYAFIGSLMEEKIALDAETVARLR